MPLALPNPPYDALLLVSFGGPEGPDDVVPFLENVLRGRNVPRGRMLEVAEHYYHFGGVSPINAQNRELIAALTPQLRAAGIDLPIYWGNRNWHPLLTDTVAQMARDGIQRALAFVTSAYSSYSSCRQYRENILQAQQQVGDRAPQIDQLRAFYNHPDFIAANADRLREALGKLEDAQQPTCRVAFTAHSIPLSMANTCDYVQQLEETCRLVAEELALPQDRWNLVYQSRSGRPADPWLEPDILDHLRTLSLEGVAAAVICPVGFLSDHMEVIYDLDVEAEVLCRQLNIPMVRAVTVGAHPRFVRMVQKLIEERLFPDRPREAIGRFGPNWDLCPVDCCPAPARPGGPSAAP